MDLEKGVFTANTSTGDQTISLADSGITPKAVILWAAYNTAEGIVDGDGIFSFGMGTRRGGSTQQFYTCMFNDDNVGNAVTQNDMNSDAVLKGLTAPGNDVTATDYEATLVSFGAGQFVINFSNAPASAIKIHYMVLGGSEISDAVVSTHALSTAVATQNITVASGFGQPDLVLTAAHNWTGNYNENDTRFMFGAFKSDSERMCMNNDWQDAAATMALGSWFRTDAMAVMFGSAQTADGILDVSAKASWPTDGFQIAYDDQLSFAFTLGCLSLKGTFTATIGNSAHLTAGSTLDLALASGTPEGALFYGSQVDLTAGTINTTAADLGGFFFGGTDGTHEGFAGHVDDDTNTTSRASRFHSESKAVARHIADAAGGAATLDAEADSSINGSNIRLTYGNLAAVAADFIYVIFGTGSTDIVKDLTAALETDTAQALSFTKNPISKTLGVAVETDTAQALGFTQGPAVSVSINPALETDIAIAISFSQGGGDIFVDITAATETDAAQALVFTQQAIQKTLTQALETDTAQPLAFTQQAIIKSLTQALETDAAQALGFTLGPAISVGITPALETDTAQAFGFTVGPAISLGITPALETDSAQTLGFTQGPIFKTLTPATELDVAQALSFVGGFEPEITIIRKWFISRFGVY